MFKKQLFGFWLVALTVLMVLAGGPAALAQDVTLVVSSYGGGYDDVFQEFVVEPFQEAFPHVEVTLAPYAGVSRLEAERERPTLDVVQLDDFDIIDAADRGLLAPIRRDQVANWDDLYEPALVRGSDGDVYGLTNVFGAWGIAYNTEHVEEPTSWQVFWDEAYANRIAFMDGWIPDMLMAALAFGGDEYDMEPAWEAVASVSERVKQFYGSFSAPQPLLESEEVWLSSWFDGRTYALQAEGVPVDFVVPEEGGILIRGALGVVEGTEHRELAEAFADYAVSVQAQRSFSEHFFYGPTNARVELPEELAARVVYGEEDLAPLLVPDWPHILAERAEWMDRWSRASIGF